MGSPAIDYDYESDSAFMKAVSKVCYQQIIKILEEKPPETQMAILLHEHIKDVTVFREETIQRFDKVDERFDKVDERLDNLDKRFDNLDKRCGNLEKEVTSIKETMVTKQELHEWWDGNDDKLGERKRLLQGIGELLKEHLK